MIHLKNHIVGLIFYSTGNLGTEHTKIQCSQIDIIILYDTVFLFCVHGVTLVIRSRSNIPNR